MGIRSRVFILFFVLSFSAQAEDVQLDLVYKVPTAIRYMAIIGDWKKGDDKGKVRLAVTQYKNRHRVYLQWLKGEVLLSTQGIAELNMHQHFRITLPESRGKKALAQVAFTLEDLHSRLLYQGLLKALSPGYYEFELELKD